MKVEILVEGVLDDIRDWAQARAEELGCTVGDVVNRALEAERRRVERRPRLDPRTVRVGGRGAGVQMGAGEHTIGDLETLTSVGKSQLRRLAERGFIESLRPTAPGKVAAYADVDAVIVIARRHLRGMGLNIEAVGPGFVLGLRELWPRVDGLFVVATTESSAVASETLLPGTAVRNGAIYVVSLAAARAELGDRRSAA